MKCLIFDNNPYINPLIIDINACDINAQNDLVMLKDFYNSNTLERILKIDKAIIYQNVNNFCFNLDYLNNYVKINQYLENIDLRTLLLDLTTKIINKNENFNNFYNNPELITRLVNIDKTILKFNF